MTRPMEPRRCLVVAMFVALAGCGAPFGLGQSGTPTETLTPGPLKPASEFRTQPTVQSTPPPGVSIDGSVDVRRLLSAHSEYLDGRSYTWVLTYDTTSSRETQLSGKFHRRVQVEGDRFLLEEWRSDGSVNRTLYARNSVGYVRVDTDNGSEFDSTADPRDDEVYAISQELAWRYLFGVNLTVDAVGQSGQTYYRLSTGDDVSFPLAFRGLSPRIDEYRVTAYVTPEGLVKTLAVEYDRVNASHRQHVSVRFDYEALDRTTVSRPDWVDQVSPVPGSARTSHSKSP